MVVKIIIEMVRMRLAESDEGIGSLIRELEDPVESVELRMNIVTPSKDAKAKGTEAVETLRRFIEVYMLIKDRFVTNVISIYHVD